MSPTGGRTMSPTGGRTMSPTGGRTMSPTGGRTMRSETGFPGDGEVRRTRGLWAVVWPALGAVAATACGTAGSLRPPPPSPPPPGAPVPSLPTHAHRHGASVDSGVSLLLQPQKHAPLATTPNNR